MIPFSFTDYVTAIQAQRVCTKYDLEDADLSDFDLSEEQLKELMSNKFAITGINAQGYNWPVPFVKCDSRKCNEEGEDASNYCEYFGLGLAPSTESDELGTTHMKAFGDYIMERYPQLSETDNFDFDFIQYFNSDNDVESHVKNGNYGDDSKIALAIIFDGTDDDINYNYRLRVNSTNYNAPENEGRPATATTPPTDTKFSQYAKLDEECIPMDGTPELGPYQNSCTAQYIYNGALPLQRLIGDWIMEKEGAKDEGYYVSEHGVRYASFPTVEYTEDGFFAAIAGKYWYTNGDKQSTRKTKT